MWGVWLFASLYFPALHVLPLYLWHSRPRSETIRQRMLATTLATALAAWLPTAAVLWRLPPGGNSGAVSKRPTVDP